jgi:hypothetical protein
MRVFVNGIGLRGPGLDGWVASRPVLAGSADYVPSATIVPASALLPTNERRRAAQIVKIALAVGAEAFAAAARSAAATATVFASSGGDGDTIHEILNVLASSERALSPTKFHNSVHNAASGYWSIATGAQAASTSLCCHDDSFAAGLLEAVVQAVTADAAVALIAYDVPYPAPLNETRPITAPFGVALVFSTVPDDRSLASLDVTLRPEAMAAPVMAVPGLEALRRQIPAARGLPVLAALAGGTAAAVSLNYLDNMVLRLRISPV